jgi:hypothetical protein
MRDEATRIYDTGYRQAIREIASGTEFLLVHVANTLKQILIASLCEQKKTKKE